MYKYKDYLPDYIKEIREFDELGRVIDDHMVQLSTKSEQLYKNQLIDSADTQTIARWERIYGIFPRIGQSLAERKKAITARIQSQSLVTRNKLRQLVSEITGAVCSIDEVFHEYRFTVRLIQPTFETLNIEFLREQIDIIKPANLLYEIAVEKPMRCESYMGIVLVKAKTTTIREVL